MNSSYGCPRPEDVLDPNDPRQEHVWQLQWERKKRVIKDSNRIIALVAANSAEEAMAKSAELTEMWKLWSITHIGMRAVIR